MNRRKVNSYACLLTLFYLITQLLELERSLSNSLLNLEASNAELEKFKLERAQLQAQLESVSVSYRRYSIDKLFQFCFSIYFQNNDNILE